MDKINRMDSERFDTIVIPDNLSECVQNGIREGERRYMKKKRKKFMLRFAGAAAAMLVCVGVCASQPALASKMPVVGTIFKLLQGDYSYQGDLDSVAQKLEKEGNGLDGEQGCLPLGNGADGEQGTIPSEDGESGSVYTKTADGVTLSVSEAYCSVEAIYLSLRITSEEAFPDTMTDMEGKPLINLKGTAAYSFCQERGGEAEGYGGMQGSLEGAFLDPHTYVGIYRIDILDIVGNDDALKETYRTLESFDMDFTVEQIIGDKAEPEKLDMQGKTEEELEAMSDEEWKAFMAEITPPDWYQYPSQYDNWWFDGPFVFQLHIEADRKSAQTVVVDEMNDTGAGLYQVVKTKFEITVEEKCSEQREADGVFLVVLDAEGRLLPSGSSSYADTYAIHGRDVSKIFVYVCDYVEYMDEIKGHQTEDAFQKILEERALYKKEIAF